MYVIDVIPLSRTAPGVLSYRSKENLPAGTVVDITLRKTKTKGIVLSSQAVTDAKEMLKRAQFTLSGSTPSKAGVLPPKILEAAKKTAEYHATSIGAALTSLFSEYISSGTELPLNITKTQRSYTLTTVEEPVIVRIQKYSTFIAENTAKNLATLLIVPTVAEAIFWKETFRSYKPLVLSGLVVKGKRSELLTKASAYEGLVIATPSFSWIPISSLSTVIVDRVSAGTYTFPKRPYINVVRSLQYLAEARGMELVYGDYPLPLEYRIHTESPLSTLPKNIEVFDARRDPDSQADSDGPWKALPKEVISQIREEMNIGGRAIVFAARKGYAPAVVCRDCEQALTDERGLALSFSMKGGERVFRSSDGKTVISAKMVCPRCGSWNLLPLGVGEERVMEELQEVFAEDKEVNIISASSSELSTPAKARKILKEMNGSKTIVVGTESLLPWLLPYASSEEDRPLCVIASADSLLALPFWRARERFVRLSFFAASVSRKLCVVTRKPEDSAVSLLSSKDSSDQSFFTEETNLRKILGYPPFGTIISLCVEGNLSTVESETLEIQKTLSTHPLVQLPDRIVEGTRTRRMFIVFLSNEAWPNDTLARAIEGVSPRVRVQVDIESLW